MAGNEADFSHKNGGIYKLSCILKMHANLFPFRELFSSFFDFSAKNSCVFFIFTKVCSVDAMY